MKTLYAILCFIGIHKIGEIRQFGGGRPNTKCLHCERVIWQDSQGQWRDEDD